VPLQLIYAIFLLPRPIQPVSVNMGFVMPSWYDIKSLDVDPGARTEEDESGMLKSVKTINQFVAAEVDAGIPSERVVVGGFSQGKETKRNE
jgi:predicted esterase